MASGNSAGAATCFINRKWRREVPPKVPPSQHWVHSCSSTCEPAAGGPLRWRGNSKGVSRALKCKQTALKSARPRNPGIFLASFLPCQVAGAGRAQLAHRDKNVWERPELVLVVTRSAQRTAQTGARAGMGARDEGSDKLQLSVKADLHTDGLTSEQARAQCTGNSPALPTNTPTNMVATGAACDTQQCQSTWPSVTAPNRPALAMWRGPRPSQAVVQSRALSHLRRRGERGRAAPRPMATHCLLRCRSGSCTAHMASMRSSPSRPPSGRRSRGATWTGARAPAPCWHPCARTHAPPLLVPPPPPPPAPVEWPLAEPPHGRTALLL